MLGKQITRVRSFSMVHATVLVAAIAVASLISPAIQQSALDTGHQVARSDAGPGAAVLMRVTLVKWWDCDAAPKDVDV